MQNSSAEQGALFRKAFPACLPKIKAMAAGFCSGEFTEDLVQEGLAALYCATLSFDESRGVPFEGYAIPCIRNAMISALRKVNKVPVSSLSDIEDIPYAFTPDDNALLKDEYQNIKETLKANLSPFEYRVLSLYIDGYSYSQTAKILSKPVKSVDNAMARTRRKLSNIFK